MPGYARPSTGYRRSGSHGYLGTLVVLKCSSAAPSVHRVTTPDLLYRLTAIDLIALRLTYLGLEVPPSAIAPINERWATLDALRNIDADAAYRSKLHRAKMHSRMTLPLTSLGKVPRRAGWKSKPLTISGPYRCPSLVSRFVHGDCLVCCGPGTIPTRPLTLRVPLSVRGIELGLLFNSVGARCLGSICGYRPPQTSYLRERVPRFFPDERCFVVRLRSKRCLVSSTTNG